MLTLLRKTVILLSAHIFVPAFVLLPFILGAQDLVKTLSGHSASVLSVAFSPDGSWLISGSDDNTLKIWDLNTGKCDRTLPGPGYGIQSVTFSPDSRYFLSCSKDHKINMVSMADGSILQNFSGHSSAVYSMQFSQDNRFLLTSSADKSIRLWEVQTGKLVRLLSGHTAGVKSAVFSPDGKKILSTAWDKTIRIWDTESGRLEKTWTGTAAPVRAVFMPDGKNFVSASDDFSVLLKDAGTGNTVKTLKGHINKILSLAVSSDGNYILTGSLDGTIKLWEHSSGNCIKTFYTKSGGASCVALGPNLSYIASGSADIKLWGVFLSNKFLIDNTVQKKLAEWKLKGKYESSEAFAARVNETSIKARTSALLKLVADSVGNIRSGKLQIESLDFDPDKESFDISFANSETEGILLYVPAEEAKSFEDNRENIQFSKTKYRLNDNDLFEITYTEVLNPENNRKYVFNPFNEKELIEKSQAPMLTASQTRSLNKETIRKPVISIVQPRVERGAQYHHAEKKLTVKGNVEAEAGLFMLLVNGMETQVSSTGCFESPVVLGYNENTIIIKAVDRQNQVSTDTLNVFRPFDNSSAIISSRKGIDYALIIATDDYTNYSKLANPIHDGTSIAKELEENYGFRTEVIKNPNRSEVYSVLRNYSKKQFSDEDQLFIFIAGHGEFDEVFSEGYIVTKDSRKDDEVKETFISHSNIRTIVNNIPCKHILLAMDVCFGGTFDQFVAGSRGAEDLPVAEKEKFIKRKLALTTRKYLTSGGKEYVPDGRPGFHSPFAAKLLTALRTYGSEDRILTFNELYSIVDKAVPGPKTGEFGNNQPGSDFLFIAR